MIVITTTIMMKMIATTMNFVPQMLGVLEHGFIYLGVNVSTYLYVTV